MASTLPSHYSGLVLEAIGADLLIKILPTPTPSLGCAIVRVLHAAVLSYHREVYSGVRSYPVPTPMVGGISAIGRVAAVGEDATTLKPGQLVFVDCMVRGRDNPSALYMSAIHEGDTEGEKRLSRGAWRNGTFAEYTNAPLENCIPLDEIRLCKELGYSTLSLMYLCYLLVPYGGLRDIKLEPGETIVVSPATGGFGGAGVQVAIAMGARVIAMGRNEKELARLKKHVEKGTPSGRIETVKISGDTGTDTAVMQAFGTIDAILDLSPPAASKSTHFASAVSALRRGGRCSLMGFVENPPSSWKIVGDDITMKGKLMYQRDDIIQFIKMLERGLFHRKKALSTSSHSQWRTGGKLLIQRRNTLGLVN
jgi:D-arabinose 1-dehydrogenase-like Zn-dependent alcohol dehydrogenase